VTLISTLRGYGLASLTRESDGGGLRFVAYASESAPIFTPEFPKADPYPRTKISSSLLFFPFIQLTHLVMLCL